MKIELNREQLNALEMLAFIGDYYFDNMEPSNSCYKDDSETVNRARHILKQLNEQMLKGQIK
jgi:hypothetical protein